MLGWLSWFFARLALCVYDRFPAVSTYVRGHDGPNLKTSWALSPLLSLPKLLTMKFHLKRYAWSLEILAFAVASLTLAVLIVLLRYYDQQPIFQWHGVSLNTIVSTLSSTVFKPALMFIVSTGISQWKYIAFSRRKMRLIVFDQLDSASRGALGSLALLLNKRCWK